MTQSLESEIVTTRFDPKTRTCFYTIERNSRRWTVGVHIDEFDKAAAPHFNNPERDKQARRDHLTKAFERAVLNAPDES